LAIHRALLTLALAGLLGAILAFVSRGREATTCGGCHEPHYEKEGTCVGCHRGRPDTDRKELGHHRLLRGAAAAWGMPGALAVEEGARLRESSGCRRCHVSGGEGNAFAIALDDVVWKRDQAELRASILEPVSTMPDFGFTGGQADRMIAVLLRDARQRPAVERYLVRFRQGPPARPHPFERLCGPCHRALTAGGPMGVGASAADLSGLLTRHYPAGDGRRWDRARLERWLRNPRAERAQAIMPPVTVGAGELDAIVDVLSAQPGR
jgi:hypothetical protein